MNDNFSAGDPAIGSILAHRPKATGRYSDQRLATDFAAVVLFAAPVDCLKREIVAEVSGEYPMLGIEEQSDLNSELSTDAAFDTSMKSNSAGHRHISRLHSEPGRYDADFAYALRHSYAFDGAREAAVSHSAWVRVSTPSESDRPSARFRAATATTCIAASFSKLPGCLGVYLPAANLIISPERWARAADEAAIGEFPIDAWIALAIGRTEREGPSRTLASCSSIGLAAFDGHEVHLPWSDMPPGDAARLVFSTLWMLLIGGSRFSDGDTMGREGEAIQIRIRHACEGVHGMQTDAWLLFDPSTVVQESKLFPAVNDDAPKMRENPRISRLFGLFGPRASRA